MSPEERAMAVWQECTLSSDPSVFLRAVAQAIRDAVAEERKIIAKRIADAVIALKSD